VIGTIMFVAALSMVLIAQLAAKAKQRP
jgi:hypothetical protein